MTHRPHALPLHWTLAEEVWLAAGPDNAYLVIKTPDCRKRCWALQIGHLGTVGSFRTLRAAKLVAQSIEAG